MIEILDQTPPIPANAQWGLFLRNHDELTLEMVTDEERDYMYAEYAKDPRMKLNLGIRRRLAPLLDNGRDEIELMHAILFSLPGFARPLLRRRDRHGRQRLPRRPRRRAHADAVDGRPQRRLLARRLRAALPAAADGSRSTATRPSTSRRSCARRPRSCAGCTASSRCARQHPVFGLGDYEALRPENPQIFAHIRRSRRTSCSACTTSRARRRRSSSTCRAFEGHVPEEMLGRTPLPARSASCRTCSRSAPRGFFWFQLRDPAGVEHERELQTRIEAGDLRFLEGSTCSGRSRRSAGSAPSRASARRARARRRLAPGGPPSSPRARRGPLRPADPRPLPPAARLPAGRRGLGARP